jgi:hypothetical protein
LKRETQATVSGADFKTAEDTMQTKIADDHTARADVAWRPRDGWEADAERCAAAGDDALLLGAFPNRFDASMWQWRRRGRSLRVGSATGKVKSR